MHSKPGPSALSLLSPWVPRPRQMLPLLTQRGVHWFSLLTPPAERPSQSRDDPIHLISSLLQFHRRCYKGIPSQVRGSIWMLMLDVNTKKAQNVGKYKVWMCTQPTTHLGCQVASGDWVPCGRQCYIGAWRNLQS